MTRDEEIEKIGLEKALKFQRILPTRIENFKLSAERLGKLSNRVYFSYTEEQKQSIHNEIDEICSFLKSKFK